MQYFRDASTGKLHAFEDDVKVSLSGGVHCFETARGMKLATPATLQPATAPAPELPSPASRAAALLKAGLAISSATAPALDGTYPADAPALRRLGKAWDVLKAANAFPGARATWPIRDAAGAAHECTAAQFTAIVTVLTAFAAECELVADGHAGATLPAASVTIA